MILQAILTKARNGFESHLLFPVFIPLNISLAVKHEWKNKSSSSLSSVLALFFNSCFIQTCSTRLSLPAISNTSKILGVSIPNCACVTKHKTNICCRGKTKHGGPFQRLVGHFHTGSLSAGGQRCQSPALPLSPTLLSFLFSCISHVIFEWSLVEWFS